MSANAIRAGRAYLELSLRRSKFLSGLRSTEKNFVGSLQRMSKSVAVFGAKLLGGGIGGLGSFVLPVQQFASFERALDEVYSITGEGGKLFKDLEQRAKELGATTVFSSTEAANAMTVFARAGLKTKQIIDAIGPTLDTAAVGKLDLSEAANIVRGVIQGMGKDFSEAKNVIDVLTQASVSASTDLQGLGDAFRYVGPLARLGGETIEEVAAATMSLADANITGEMAGTTIRGSILALLSPSKEAIKELARLGVQTKDANGDFIGFINVIGQLETALNGVGSGDKLESLGKIFQQRQASGVAQLINDGAGSLQANADALGIEGISRELADIQLDNVFGDFTRFMSVLKNVGIAIGSALEAPLRQLFKVINKSLGDLEKFINANKSLVASIAAGFAIVTAAGAALVTLGVSSVIVLNAFGALIGIIGSLVSALALMTIAASAIAPFVIGAIGSVLALFGSIASAIAPALLAISAIGAAVTGVIVYFGGIGTAFDAISGKIVQFGSQVKSALESAAMVGITAFNKLVSAVSYLADNAIFLSLTGAVSLFSNALTGIKSVVDFVAIGFLDWLGSMAKTNGIIAVVVSATSTLYKALSGLLGFNIATLTKGFYALAKVISSQLNAIIGAGSFVVSVLVSHFANLFSIASGIFRSQSSNLISIIMSVFASSEIGTLLINIFSSIWGSIVTTAMSAFDSIKGGFSQAGSFLSSAFSQWWEVVSSFYIGLADIAESSIKFIGDTFSSIGSLIGSAFAGAPKWFDFLSKTFTSKIDTIWSTFTTTFKGIYDALSSGDLALAGKIGLDALKLITISTLDIIASVFGTTTEGLVDLWASAIREISTVWLGFQRLLHEGNQSIAGILSNIAEHFGIVVEGTTETLKRDQAFDSEKFKREEQEKINEILKSEKDRKKKLKQLINDFRASEGRIKTNTFKAEFEREQAEKKPDLDRPDVKPGVFDSEKFKPDFKGLNDGQKKTKATGSSIATFVGAAAPGLGGTNPMVEAVEHLKFIKSAEEKKAAKAAAKEKREEEDWAKAIEKQEGILLATESTSEMLGNFANQIGIA